MGCNLHVLVVPGVAIVAISIGLPNFGPEDFGGYLDAQICELPFLRAGEDPSALRLFNADSS